MSLFNQESMQSVLAWKGKKGLNLEEMEFNSPEESETYRRLLIEGNTDVFFLSPMSKKVVSKAPGAIVLTWEWNFIRSLYFWWNEL